MWCVCLIDKTLEVKGRDLSHVEGDCLHIILSQQALGVGHERNERIRNENVTFLNIYKVKINAFIFKIYVLRAFQNPYSVD